MCAEGKYDHVGFASAAPSSVKEHTLVFTCSDTRSGYRAVGSATSHPSLPSLHTSLTRVFLPERKEEERAVLKGCGFTQKPCVCV